MIWPESVGYLSSDDTMSELLSRAGDIESIEVPEKYRVIWKEISFLVQLNKAQNYRLSELETRACFSQLIKRPYYLARLAGNFNAKNILEVGTAEGLQFYSFAEQVKENNGHVWSCDIVDKRNVKYAELYDKNTTFCLGTSKELGELVKEKIDLFYIDASHQRGAVLNDINNLKHLQSDEPIWIFDDFDQRFGCFEDIKEVCKSVGRFKIYRVGNAASGNPNHQVVVFGKLP